MLQPDVERLHAAHGKPGHGAVIPFRFGPVSFVHKRNEIIHEHLVQGGKHGIEIAGRATAAGRTHRIGSLTGFPGIAVRHDDEHRPRLLFRYQIIHDVCHVALDRPAALIFAAAVLEIEHWITGCRISLIVGRRIDKNAPPALRGPGKITPLAHLPMRHVLRLPPVLARRGNLDAAGHAAHAVERLGGRITHIRPVHEERVVMKSQRDGTEGDRPVSLCIALHRMRLPVV